MHVEATVSFEPMLNRWVLLRRVVIDNEVQIKFFRGFPVDLHLIIDNYATHKHPAVQHWLKAHGRFHMHFTPTSSSWLNLVERFFGELTSDVVREGSFQSLRELVRAIESYLAERNQNPKKYVWRASGLKILEKIQRAKEALASEGVIIT